MAGTEGADGEPLDALVLLEDPNFEEVEDLEQLPEHLLRELENFFDVYKMLEPGTTPPPPKLVAVADRAYRPLLRRPGRGLPSITSRTTSTSDRCSSSRGLAE